MEPNITYKLNLDEQSYPVVETVVRKIKQIDNDQAISFYRPDSLKLVMIAALALQFPNQYDKTAKPIFDEARQASNGSYQADITDLVIRGTAVCLAVFSSVDLSEKFFELERDLTRHNITVNHAMHVRDDPIKNVMAIGNVERPAISYLAEQFAELAVISCIKEEHQDPVLVFNEAR